MKPLLLSTLLAASLALFVTGCDDKDDHKHENKWHEDKEHHDKDDHKAQALIEKIGKGRFTVVSQFKAADDLDGFIIQSQQGAGQPAIMYADEDGHYALYGTLIGEDGQNLSEEQKNKYVTPLLAKKIAENISLATSFKEGSDTAPYKMFVLADPNCSACHAFYNVVKDPIAKGELQVSWILVYFVQQDSQAKAAAILNAADPAAAMAENEAKFDMSKEEGGIQALSTIPPELSQQLANNMKFMSNAGINSTPTVIFYNAAGDLTYVSGAPMNMEEFLKTNKPQITKQ